MTYKVVITPRAQDDLKDYVARIAEHSESKAADWLSEAIASTMALSELPMRFPLVQEAENLGQDIRSFPFHSHRIVYWIDGANAVVYILRVYHMARRPLNQRDLSW